jgi:Sodium/hydrogen exchanger family
MSLQQLYVTLLVGSLVVLVSIVATRVASRVGLPSLLLFLALGVVLGEDVLGIEFNDAQLAQDLGTAALAVILIEGGLTTAWSDIRSVIAPAGVLASAGVGMSTAVTAVGAHYLLAMGWQQALLLGAILASTDAAAVFSILRVLPLPQRVAGLLEAESGFNDAPSVILVLLFSTTPFHLSAPALVGTLLYELAAGAAIGVALGWLGAIALPRIALPASGLYPLATFGLGIVAFAAAGAAHASGFLAAYLAALVLANAGLLVRRPATPRRACCGSRFPRRHLGPLCIAAGLILAGQPVAGLGQSVAPLGPGGQRSRRRLPHGLAIAGVLRGVDLRGVGENLLDLRQRPVGRLRRVAGQFRPVQAHFPSDTTPSAASSRSTWLNGPPSGFSCRLRNRAIVA